MKSIICLYDIKNWAIYNILSELSRLFGDKLNFKLIQYKDYYNNPIKSDIIYISFLFLYKSNFPYKNYAKEVICSIHSPSEISNFTNTLHWKDYPFRNYNLNLIDRISTISNELFDVMNQAYKKKLYLTLTFPLFLKDNDFRNTQKDKIVLMASTRLTVYHGIKHYLSRLKNVSLYLKDHYGKYSLKQISSLFIFRTYKNVRLLKLIKKYISQHPYLTGYIHIGEVIWTRNEYNNVLQDADIYICTSNMEGGPIPMIEAAQTGTALLSTPVGQAHTILKEGENGYYCKSYDEFINRIEGYIKDPKLLESHKKKSKEFSDSIDTDLSEWHKFLTGE